METVSFKTTKKDADLISRIAIRASQMAKEHQTTYPRLECEMDVTACHVNAHRIDLELLLNADDFNFAHDVFGIRNHLNRETGQLTNCFLPRFSR